jgi:hypothetical protein
MVGGTEQVVASALTAPDGTWSAAVPAPQESSVLRAVYLGGAGPGVISNVVGVKVVG